jgi:XapX domain-containing protein
MKILIAFIVAFAIGAASRGTGVPSLAPQAIIGALLIVAMSTGYVSADRLLKRSDAPSPAVSVSTGDTAELGVPSQEAIAYESPATPEPQKDAAFWRQKTEGLQLIIADLLLKNQQLRTSGNTESSLGANPVPSHPERPDRLDK